MTICIAYSLHVHQLQGPPLPEPKQEAPTAHSSGHPEADTSSDTSKGDHHE